MAIKKFARKDENILKAEKAVSIRTQIDDLYKQYSVLKNIFKDVFNEDETKLKEVVDGIYYLGGGWPSPNSKGRLELAVEKFATLFRFLKLIGKEHLITDELEKYGITIKQTRQIKTYKLSDIEIQYLKREHNRTFPLGITNKDILQILINDGLELQRDICQLADKCKDLLKNPENGIEEIEMKRLYSIVRIKAKPKSKQEKVNKRVNKILTSMDGFTSVANRELKQKGI